MKKLFIFIFSLAFLCTGLFGESIIEEEKQSNFSVEVFTELDGLLSVIGKPYLGETIGASFILPHDVKINVGVRLEENILKHTNEPFIYFAPIIDFTYKHFYLGGGPLFFFSDDKSFNSTFILKSGCEFGNWEINQNKLNLRIGLAESFRIVNLNNNKVEENDLSDAFGVIFGTIFSFIPMLDIGVACYLPF